MIGLRVYELNRDRDRDVSENASLAFVSDEVLELAAMVTKMESLETSSPNDMFAAAVEVKKPVEINQSDSSLDRTLDSLEAVADETEAANIAVKVESEEPVVEATSDDDGGDEGAI